MRKALFIVLTFVISFGFTTKAFALTVSPAKIEIRVNPGQTAKGEIEIFNEQSETKTFYSSFENFESKGDTGAPYFTGANSGLATWITSDSEVSLIQGERKKVPYTITVPENAKPGGYFAAIFFGTEKPKTGNGGEVSIGGKIGVLVLLRVNGEVSESAGLSGFQAKDSQRFFTTVPVTFEYSLNNTGGDRVVPKGEVVIRNTLQMKTATLLANEKEGSVLPSSTRKFEVVFGENTKDKDTGFFDSVKKEWGNFNFGWYTASLNITWGESQQTGANTYSFFIIPWHLLIVILVALIVLKIVLGLYKKSVIAAATKVQQK